MTGQTSNLLCPRHLFVSLVWRWAQAFRCSISQRSKASEWQAWAASGRASAKSQVSAAVIARRSPASPLPSAGSRVFGSAISSRLHHEVRPDTPDPFLDDQGASSQRSERSQLFTPLVA